MRGIGVEWVGEGHVVGWWVDSNILDLQSKEKEKYKNRRKKKDVRVGGSGRREEILYPPPQGVWKE